MLNYRVCEEEEGADEGGRAQSGQASRRKQKLRWLEGGGLLFPQSVPVRLAVHRKLLKPVLLGAVQQRKPLRSSPILSSNGSQWRKARGSPLSPRRPAPLSPALRRPSRPTGQEAELLPCSPDSRCGGAGCRGLRGAGDSGVLGTPGCWGLRVLGSHGAGGLGNRGLQVQGTPGCQGLRVLGPRGAGGSGCRGVGGSRVSGARVAGGSGVGPADSPAMGTRTSQLSLRSNHLCCPRPSGLLPCQPPHAS